MRKRTEFCLVSFPIPGHCVPGTHTIDLITSGFVCVCAFVVVLICFFKQIVSFVYRNQFNVINDHLIVNHK